MVGLVKNFYTLVRITEATIFCRKDLLLFKSLSKELKDKQQLIFSKEPQLRIKKIL